MKNTTNNEMEKSQMFSPLLNEEPSVTLAELQRHVANTPPPGRSYRFPALVMISAIGLGFYLVFGNESIEKNTAWHLTSVKKSATLSSMPPIQRQELKNRKISNLSGSKVKRNLTVLHVKNNELGAVNVVKDSALLDPKIFNAVCGKNVFIASTAKIDMMPLLEPAASDFNTNIVNIPAGVFSN